ncbi:hypothetical protein HNQ07_004006 [Deinococcus metalli]|uniref:Uncharacterized protein n=1 Tax=Deinococcus metalli TaxID=1141878 RepID=A0A7W8NQ02_9DEIO|nr:hypothetical protein [Deinococcus metalli]
METRRRPPHQRLGTARKLRVNRWSGRPSAPAGLAPSVVGHGIRPQAGAKFRLNPGPGRALHDLNSPGLRSDHARIATRCPPSSSVPTAPDAPGVGGGPAGPGRGRLGWMGPQVHGEVGHHAGHGHVRRRRHAWDGAGAQRPAPLTIGSDAVLPAEGRGSRQLPKVCSGFRAAALQCRTSGEGIGRVKTTHIDIDESEIGGHILPGAVVVPERHRYAAQRRLMDLRQRMLRETRMHG